MQSNSAQGLSLKKELSELGDASYFEQRSPYGEKIFIRNVPYFFPVDEYGIAKTAEKLKASVSKPTDRQTIHIGIAGSQNLTHIARCKMDGGILIDINYLQKRMWQKIESLVAQSPTRQAFVENFTRELKAGEHFCQTRDAELEAEAQETHILKPIIPSDREADYEGLVVCRPYERNAEESIRHELTSSESWLSNDEDYKHIRDLFMSGQIVAFNLDLLDTPRVNMLAEFLRSNKLHVGSFYISNVLETYDENRKTISWGKHLGTYGQQQPANAEKIFFENLRGLTHEDTVIVDAEMGRTRISAQRHEFHVSTFTRDELEKAFFARVGAEKKARSQ